MHDAPTAVLTGACHEEDLRTTGTMGLLLALHLGIILALFAVLPCGKFDHGLYRSAALLRHAMERPSQRRETTMTHAEKCLAFKSLHEQPGPFVMPNPWDAGSARILAGAGFKALATTSAGAAFTLGRVDGTVSRDEALANARAIVGATDLPVSADLENCYGHDPETVAATMILAGEAGLAGASVEDATGDPMRPIYEHDHAVARVAAAVRAARSRPHPFTVTARAENFLHGRRDLDDVIRRLQAFVAVGADVVYAPGLPDIAAIRLVTSSAGRPVNVLVNAGLATTVSELGAAGVRRISLGGAVCRAAFGALFRAAREMAEQGSFGFLAEAASISEINACMATGKEESKRVLF